MARIPGAEGLGEQVARPVSFNQTQTPAGAFGGQVAQVLGGIGADMAREERRQEVEAEQTRRAADKARALTALQSAQDDLQTITDEVADGVVAGTVDKATASEEFQRRARERVTLATESLPDEFRELGQVELTGKVNRFGRTVGKAVTQRNQSEVRGGIEQTLEYAGRLYLKDPAAADQMALGALDQLGPQSGLDPQQLQRLRQSYKEGSRYNLASSLVNSSRRDNAALDAVATRLTGDEFADLDPGRKTQLLTSLEGYKVSNIQRAESAARQRQAQQERALRIAESQFGAANAIISSGKVLSPEYVDKVSKAVAGTPYQDAFREALRQAPENTAFGVQSLPTQARLLAEARATLNVTGTNPVAEKRVAELEQIHRQAVQDYAADPLLAALERGIVQSVAPLAINDVPSLVGSIAERVQQAQLASQQAGQVVSPLLKAEAEQVGKMLAVLPVEQRSSAIAKLAEAVGPEQAAVIGRQLAPRDQALGLSLAMAGAKTTQGRYTSELVLRGAQAIKDKTVAPDTTKEGGWRREIAALIGDAYPNEEVRQATIEAAYLARAGLEAEGGGTAEKAVLFVTGGITKRQGKKLPLPYGVTANDFDKKLRAINPAALAGQAPDGMVYVGSTPMPLADFVAGVPEAQLVHAGQGRYAVSAGGGLATNARRQPIIIEVR